MIQIAREFNLTYFIMSSSPRPEIVMTDTGEDKLAIYWGLAWKPDHIEVVPDLLDSLGEGPLRLTMFGNPESTSKAKEQLDDLDLPHKMIIWDRKEYGDLMLEIMHPGGSKSNGVFYLARQYGITRDEVMAVGDNVNDLDMLRWAKYGFAVANSSPELLAEFPETIPSNDEDGVAVIIEKMILGEDNK